jgi:hypothetical protein
MRGDVITLLRRCPWIPLLTYFITESFIIPFFALITSLPIHDVIAIDVRLYALNNPRIAGRIFLKFGMDVMTLVLSLKPYFLVSLNRLLQLRILNSLRWVDDGAIIHEPLRVSNDVKQCVA